MIPRFLFSALLFTVLAVSASAQDEFYHPELNWRTIETPHFYVNYHEGEERTARTIAKIAEEIYGPVTSLYHHEPDGKVSFVVKDYDDFSNGGAYFFDNKIEIWASALDFDLRGTHNWLRNVITHEFTHVVQIQTSLKFGRRVPAFYLQWLQYESERRTDVLYGYPNGIVSYPVSGYVIPSWFAEGVAQFNRRELGYDSWDAVRDMILRMYALDSTMLTWNEMSVFGKTSLGNESSYNAGFAFVKYISDRFGDQILEKISRNLTSLTALTIDGAIADATGKEGKDLYDEWRASVQDDYFRRTSGIRPNPVAGELIAPTGFGNFYPSFSPDGASIAYVSNKTADYFALSSLYLYNVATKEDKLLKTGVRSAFSWSPDGKKIYYGKITQANSHWSNIADLYVYDIARDDETRLTHGLRAHSPAVSPDGSTIAFLAGSDGTINLYTMRPDGSGIRRLTNYSGGEQVYNPKWSPDGSTIMFDYSIKDGRDIASIPAGGGEVSFLLATPADERNAVFTADGSSIIYSSDQTGIFNLYEMDLRTKQTTQLTNVLGGAFMPSVNAAGQIAFASYLSSGYKIALLGKPAQLASPPGYLPPEDHRPPAFAVLPDTAFDWKKLRQYDDSKLPAYTDTTYRNIATSLAFIPFLRVDNYNPKNKGIDLLKVGLYMYSYDVLDRYGFFAGAAMNKLGERDLFFDFDYRGKVPGLFQLGLEPEVSLEAYNLTRNASNVLMLREDLKVPIDVTYNLLEFDVAFKEKLFTTALDAELRYAHSRYNADIGTFSFVDPTDPNRISQLVQASGALYLIGNDLSFRLDFRQIGLSRTSEINPIGRKIMLKYDYEFNLFNPDNNYTVDPSSGILTPNYEHVDFHRLEGSWKEMVPLPGFDHAITGQVRAGAILPHTVDQFFDFYIGGLAGMKGYPFYSLGGNDFFMSNLTYRFPLLGHIDMRLLQIYFDKLYAAAYGDAGNAWTGGGLTGQKMKYDAGLELRLEAFSYYAFPTRVFFNATYGFNQFRYYVPTSDQTVTYGQEWNFHFGVLFGFDFD
ncbi:MAG TPA: biopolymer transporter Tol [Bacteroidota bacterium]|nr:biopolymer transporter Tol [Bacteroidota bacterium]